MNNNKDILLNALDQMLGLKVDGIKLGHGSFLTIDFGRKIENKVKTGKGDKIAERGEWHLWVYMCPWRIDKQNTPWIGSNDHRKLIEKKLCEINCGDLVQYKILNDSLDTCFIFNNDIVLSLFDCSVIEDEHWMLFTPDDHVFTLGPGNQVSYGLA